MRTCDEILDASGTLYEELMQHLQDAVVEEGPVVAILDGNGGCWSTGSQPKPMFAREDFLGEFCGRVADGWEPATAVVDGWSIAAGQLHTNGDHRGYVVIGLPAKAEHAAAHQPLVEMLLHQINTIAELVHENNRLCPHLPLSEEPCRVN